MKKQSNHFQLKEKLTFLINQENSPEGTMK